MTDSSNTLTITGDGDGNATISTGEDNVSAVDTTGWSKSAETDNGTSVTYEYSKDGSGDSITLTIDDNINNTGL